MMRYLLKPYDGWIYTGRSYDASRDEALLHITNRGLLTKSIKISLRDIREPQEILTKASDAVKAFFDVTNGTKNSNDNI